ncbi:MAG: hypothetical protein SCALA702_06350 [Melioribacteraceae bacterium]|nr:MAG: hypothetical protein SCALA702_06350 [Melioribacteraceae bacterium]
MEYISISEAAEILEVSRSYIWQLVRQSRLEAQKIGNTYIVSKASLLNFKEERNGL